MQVGCQRGGGHWALGIRDSGLAGVVLVDELGFIPAIGLVVSLSLSLRCGAPEKLEAKTQKQEPKSKS